MTQLNKIVITGPVGAGKTTAIMQLSDIAPITTEQIATDDTRSKKKYTTVAMDYGSIKLHTGEIVHLYGTPGQQRFNFTWDVLIEGGIGLVLLLDHSNSDPLQDLRFYVRAFEEFIDQNAIVVGLTHMNYSQGPKIDDYHRALNEFGVNPAVFEVDPREMEDVVILVQALLFTLDPGLVSTHTEIEKHA